MKPAKSTYLTLLLTHIAFFGASSTIAYNTTSFFKCLFIQFKNANIIYTPNNTSYSSIFQFTVRNERVLSSSSRKPIAIIVPTKESQIQMSVNCLRIHDIQIQVRSGGHDYEGLSYVSEIESPFVILDMRNFQYISINTTDGTAWVQTGATLGQLYYTIAQSSSTLGFPAGVCPTVGIGGHFSGGGYSMMSRKHGISADHIIDAKIIDANGRSLERKTMGEDLFWAIRGGGGTSFGIVVAFKIKLVQVPETVTVFKVSRTLDQNATQLVHKWQHVSDKIDDNLLIRLFLINERNTENSITQLAVFRSFFLGQVGDLLPIMREKFPELGLEEHDCIEMSWIESILFFADLENEPVDTLLDRTQYLQGVYFKGKSDYVRKVIPEHGITRLWEFLKEMNDSPQNKKEEVFVDNAEIQFSPCGGRLSEFSDSETPFPHRKGNIYMIQYAVYWYANDNNESERYVNWIRSIYSYMARHVSKSPRAAYVNYRDLDIGVNNERNTSYEQASVWGFKYFNNNFNRLVSVKTKVDPSNFFRNEQSIPSVLGYVTPSVTSHQVFLS